MLYTIPQIAEKLSVNYDDLYYLLVKARVKIVTPAIEVGKARLYNDTNLEMIKNHFEAKTRKRKASA